MKRTFCAMVCFVCTVPIAVAAAFLPGAAGIRDIHESPTTAALPPFATTLLLMFSGMAWLLIRVLRKSRPAPQPVVADEKADVVFRQLRRSLEAGEVTLPVFCHGLARLIGAHAGAGHDQALTSAEIVTAAKERVPESTLNRIAGLLEFCDRVRFGGDRPGRATVANSLDEAHLLFLSPGEGGV